METPKTVYEFRSQHIRRASVDQIEQPVDEGTACVPHRGGDEVEEALAFVVDLFEGAVVLESADVDPFR